MLKFKSYEELFENEALKKKASKSGVSYGTLKKVFNRGMAAWKSGHRPGTTPQQWGHARVNSYITKGKGTYYGADSDLSGKGKKKDKKEGYVSYAQQKAAHASMAEKGKKKKSESVEEDKKGLWHNINMKRKRGEPMRKKGEKGAPTDDAIRSAQREETKVNEISKSKARRYIGYAARDVYNLGKRDQAASDIGRLGGTHPDQDYKKGPERKAAKRVGGIDRATKILMKKGRKEQKEGKMSDADKKAYADFFKRGGKVTKLPPGKAAGWHGKSDPGAGMKGMLAKGSAKKLGLRKHGKHLDTSTPVHKD